MLKFYEKALVKAATFLVKCYSYTQTSHVIYHETLNNQLPEQFIKVIWHDSLLINFQFNHIPGIQQAVVSSSKDGDYLVEMLKSFNKNHVFIRGSSRKKSLSAIKQLLDLKASQQKIRLTISPDGPMGPKRKIKRGFDLITQKLDVPIIPCISLSNNHWSLSTWDRHIIPKPRSKSIIYYGKPIENINNIDDIQKAMDITLSEASTILDTI